MLHGKINAELFQFARRAKQHGLPCFAGFPMVRSLLDLGREFQTHWFPLIGEEQGDVHFQIDLSQPHLAPKTIEDGHPLQIVELSDLGDAVENAPVLLWPDVIKAIRSVRHPHRWSSYGEFFRGGSLYNPVYVLVPE